MTIFIKNVVVKTFTLDFDLINIQLHDQVYAKFHNYLGYINPGGHIFSTPDMVLDIVRDHTMRLHHDPLTLSQLKNALKAGQEFTAISGFLVLPLITALKIRHPHLKMKIEVSVMFEAESDPIFFAEEYIQRIEFFVKVMQLLRHPSKSEMIKPASKDTIEENSQKIPTLLKSLSGGD